MSHIISFNKKGYDPFIDFLKAYAILCVLFGHTFPHLNEIGYGMWAGMQVPIFILIQSFHSLKKELTKLNIIKVAKRIFIPFAITTTITIAFLLASRWTCAGGGKSLCFSDLLKNGGIGPGCYYPWIFLQLAILLPVIQPILKKGSRIKQVVFAIAICETFEIICSAIEIPEYLYRLLMIRYLFLIFLAYMWVRNGIVLNTTTLILSLISLAAIIYFEYFSVNDEPWFFNTSWKFHRWPCYYYVSSLLCYILFIVYQKISKIDAINRAIRILAKCSYEIFLVQMVLIALFPNYGLVWMIVIVLSSIAGGYLFNKWYGILAAKQF